MKTLVFAGALLLAMAQSASAEMTAYDCVQDGFNKTDKMTIDYEKKRVKWFTRAWYTIHTIEENYLFAAQSVPGKPWVFGLMFELDTGKFWHSNLSAIYCQDDDCVKRAAEASIATGSCKPRGS